MKKKLLMVLMSAMLAMGVLGLAGCSSDDSDDESDEETTEEEATEEEEEEESEGTTLSGDISVYSREEGSGTRSAFVELLGIEQEDENGDDVDMTTSSAVILNSTSGLLSAVSEDENGIGYVSMGSLNDSVKAISIDGVEATTDNVANGTYAVSRPFNIVTLDEISDVAQDFIDFILSADGQAIVEEEGYIAVVDDAEEYESSGLSGKIVVAGSTSVSPVMEVLIEAYEELNPDVTIELQTNDSSTGISMTEEGTCDIGMASRELKDSETEAGVSSTTIAMDGIAVIVNNDSDIDDLSSEIVCQIYTGEITTWEEVYELLEE